MKRQTEDYCYSCQDLVRYELYGPTLTVAKKRSGARKPSQTGNRLLRACAELDETGVLQDEMCYIRYYALTEDDLRFLRWFMSHFILIFNFISFLRAIALQLAPLFRSLSFIDSFLASERMHL